MRQLLVLTCAMVLVDAAFCATLVPYLTAEHTLSKLAVGVLSGALGRGCFWGREQADTRQASWGRSTRRSMGPS